MRFRVLTFEQAEALMWGGAAFLAVASIVAYDVFGPVVQLSIVTVLLFWGIFVRRCLCKE
jgi:hypothetical protein